MMHIKNQYNSPLYADYNLANLTLLNLKLKGPLTTYGEPGEAGQVLTAQGGNMAPKWVDAPGGSSLPTFTSGSIIFSDGTDLTENQIQLHWDDTATSLNIGTNTTIPSAKVNIESTTQGFLLPRMSELEMGDIVSPVDGLMIYNTDNHLFYYYNANDTRWVQIATE